MQNQLNTQRRRMHRRTRPTKRLASVHDLKEGLDMVEERPAASWAWSSQGEIYVQYTADALTSSYCTLDDTGGCVSGAVNKRAASTASKG